jgi:hypothetical protein
MEMYNLEGSYVHFTSNGRTECFRTRLGMATANAMITRPVAQGKVFSFMGGWAVRCQVCEGRMMRKSFQHFWFLTCLSCLNQVMIPQA